MMMQTAAVLLSGLALTATAAPAQHSGAGVARYSFKPENSSSYWTPDIPILFNFSESQFANTVYGKAAGSSYWSTSYITGTDGGQYLAISHILVGADNATYYRASTLDLNNLKNYHSFISYSNQTALQDDSRLRVELDGNGFQSLTDDNLSQLRTYSNHGNVTFAITYNATSAAIVDAGTGLFDFGNGQSYEWGFPNCYTEGNLTIDGQQVAIDPQNSFTWYDRQWNNGFPSNGNWTWFELHIPDTRYKFSIWAIDDANPDQAYRFATIRAGDGSQNVVPTTFTPDYTRHWYSNATGTLYAQDWVVTIGDYGVFRISSATENQEIAGNTAFSTAYEGFVTFDGQFYGKKIDGFGVVEVLFAK